MVACDTENKEDGVLSSLVGGSSVSDETVSELNGEVVNDLVATTEMGEEHVDDRTMESIVHENAEKLHLLNLPKGHDVTVNRDPYAYVGYASLYNNDDERTIRLVEELKYLLECRKIVDARLEDKINSFFAQKFEKEKVITT